MLTLGVDLAASPKNTAVCLLEWRDGGASVVAWASQATDAELLALIARSDKAGIDVPLGWPDAFVAALTSYGAMGPWPEDPAKNLRLRATDRFVWEKTRITPLSVSSDKIAAPAMRAAALLTAYSRDNGAVDRTGRGKIVEVYPAAALQVWGFTHTQYKGKKRRVEREALISKFKRETGSWLELDGDCYTACLSNDNAFDSVIASLAARSSALGLTEPVQAPLAEAAAREGWIALPLVNSLKSLSPSQ